MDERTPAMIKEAIAGLNGATRYRLSLATRLRLFFCSPSSQGFNWECSVDTGKGVHSHRHEECKGWITADDRVIITSYDLYYTLF